MLVIVLLLFALIHKEDAESKQRTQQKELQRLEQELKNLKQDVQKLKIVKASSAKTKRAATQTQIPTVRQAVNYPIGCEQYKPLVAKYSWDINVAMAVMYAESGCNPNAVSSTNDHGLFQLHGIPIYNPAENVAYAYNNKYLAGGWSHWTVCNVGIVDCW